MHEARTFVEFFPTNAGNQFATINYDVTGSIKAEAKNPTDVFAKVNNPAVTHRNRWLHGAEYR